MNRDTIKLVALFTMLLNHIGFIFLHPPLSTVFIDIGYFTCITMCYFLVEGFRHTRSRKKYALRLFVFALVSQLPYSFAFARGVLLSFDGLNVICSLFACLLLLCTWETCKSPDLKAILTVLLLAVCAVSDWSLLAPAFVYLFYRADGDRDQEKKAWLISIAIFWIFELLDGTGGRLSAVRIPDVNRAFLAVSGQLAAALCILYLYNGKKSGHFQTFYRWFPYLFYPVHLLILGGIRFGMGL